MIKKLNVMRFLVLFLLVWNTGITLAIILNWVEIEPEPLKKENYIEQLAPPLEIIENY